MTAIGDLLVEFNERAASKADPEVLTLTERNGFVRQRDRFNKRLATDDTSKYKVVRRNDIAFNPYLLWAGAVAQNTIIDEGIISPLYPTFRVRPGFDPRYVARFLLTPQMIGAYDGIAFGSVPRRRRSSVKDFLELSIPTPPPIEEQRRIAAILDHADALLRKRRQALTKLDALPRSLFIESFGDPHEWHRRWPMGTIGELATSVTYGTAAKAGASGEWPILRMGNVTDDGRLDLGDLKYIDLEPKDVVKYTVQLGDLVFNRTNSKEKVGKAAVIRTDTPLALAGYLIRVRFADSATAEFVSAYLASAHGLAVRRRLAKAAVNQANINATEMRGIAIAVPPAEARSTFEAAVHAVAAQRVLQQGALAADEWLVAALQRKAFRGEL